MMGHLVTLYRHAQSLLVPERVVMRRFVARELPAAGVSPGICVDVGAGTAPYEEAVTRAVPGLRYVATDLIRGDRTMVAADAFALPFADGSVSLVCFFQVLAHLPEPARALAEARRVLRPGGHLLVAYPFLCPEGRSRDLWRWTVPGMEAVLADAGFGTVAHRPQGGPFFAGTSLLSLVPGRAMIRHRQGWRAGRGRSDMLRVGGAFLLSLPFHLAGFAALAVDRMLGPPAFYAGGMMLARRAEPARAAGVSAPPR